MIRRRLRLRDEAGYAALLVALLSATVFLGVSAIGVDTARWYVEVERVQKAADAASLAGVTYMPGDLTAARATALSNASQNGFGNTATTSVSVSPGAKPSQLRVTISSTINNSFGRALGIPTATITRSAVADFTAPALMGSPCNTFGNEPPSQPGAALPEGSALPAIPFANCSSSPQFWGVIEGPDTNKRDGDRYMTYPCSSGVYGCSGGSNDETKPEGYFFAVHVEPAAVNTPIDVQIYDPAYVYTGNPVSGKFCMLSPVALTNNLNPYATTDAKSRYSLGSSIYCSGDYLGSVTGAVPDTTFALRSATDDHDPMQAPVIPGCVKQFRGVAAPTTIASLTPALPTYNPELARIFHQWVSLCTFTPTQAGDYFLQVRTNVKLGGTPTPNPGLLNSPMVYSGNSAATAANGNTTSGRGVNSFSLRAAPQVAALRSQVSVAGYERMPMFQNTAASTAKFNLIRAMPSTAGQYIAFDFYDVADGSALAGSVTVIPPADATGSIKSAGGIPGCRGAIDPAPLADLSNCSVPVKNSTHNGKLQHMIIPIPADYTCNPATLGGCWFEVRVQFAAIVTDITVWDATIGGNPVRLVE